MASARAAGELIDGVTHDFNLMWRRGRVRAELLHRPLVGPMLFFTRPGSTVGYNYLRGEFHHEPFEHLEEATAEAYKHGWLGKNILGSAGVDPWPSCTATSAGTCWPTVMRGATPWISRERPTRWRGRA